LEEFFVVDLFDDLDDHADTPGPLVEAPTRSNSSRSMGIFSTEYGALSKSNSLYTTFVAEVVIFLCP
jgi:hypothetical protein